MPGQVKSRRGRAIATRIVLPVAAVAVATALSTAPAQADPWDGGGGNGYSVEVHVELSGDVDRARAASIPGPPPICWWEGVTVDVSDIEALKAFIESQMVDGGSSAGNMNYGLPDEEYLEQIAEQAQGDEITLYQFNYSNPSAEQYGGTEWDGTVENRWMSKLSQVCKVPTVNYTGDWLMPVRFQAFPTGQEPPPATDPWSLAAYAYDALLLVDPALDWNPKSTRTGGASLTNLPTWLWADDPAAVAERRITATAAGVTVNLTADTDGITVTSPVRSTQCTTAEARTTYRAGTPESAACLLTFPRSSMGYGNGFPVTATAVWGATWTSNQGIGGTLGGRQTEEVTDIPVAESQSLVRSTR